MSKNWDGDKNSIYKILGASNHTEKEREKNDYYATPPQAVEMLLELEDFHHSIWEPACGEGHIAKVLEEHGHHVFPTDLYDHGYGETGLDFLGVDMSKRTWAGDIITNPPYKHAREFVERAIEALAPNGRAAFFMKIQFLEGKKRRKLFEVSPPKVVYVSSSRIACWKNGEPRTSSAVCYCWYIWEKGFNGDPVIRWFN